jgi:hypothetical protein
LLNMGATWRPFLTANIIVRSEYRPSLFALLKSYTLSGHHALGRPRFHRLT